MSTVEKPTTLQKYKFPTIQHKDKRYPGQVAVHHVLRAKMGHQFSPVYKFGL